MRGIYSGFKKRSIVPTRMMVRMEKLGSLFSSVNDYNSFAFGN